MSENLKNIWSSSKEPKVIKLKSQDQNFGLSKAEFEELVDQLKNGDDRLFELIFLSHFKHCVSYLKSKYGINQETAYDTSMDTLILFRKKLLGDKIKYGNLRFLFTRMASQLLIKSNVKQDKVNQIDFYLNDTDKKQEELENILSKAWDCIEPSEQKLLQSFYYDKIPLIKIAEATGKTDSALRKQKQRSLKSLRTFFLKLYNQQ